MYKPPEDLEEQTLIEDIDVAPAEVTDSPKIAPDAAVPDTPVSPAARIAPAENPANAMFHYDPGPWAIPEKRRPPTRNFKLIMIVYSVVAVGVLGLTFATADMLRQRSAPDVVSRYLESPSVTEMTSLSGLGYGNTLWGQDGIQFKTNKTVKWKGANDFKKLVSTDALFDNRLHSVMTDFWPLEETKLMDHKDQLEIFYSGNHTIVHDKSNNQYFVHTYRDYR